MVSSVGVASSPAFLTVVGLEEEDLRASTLSERSLLFLVGRLVLSSEGEGERVVGSGVTWTEGTDSSGGVEATGESDTAKVVTVGVGPSVTELAVLDGCSVKYGNCEGLVTLSGSSTTAPFDF